MLPLYACFFVSGACALVYEIVSGALQTGVARRITAALLASGPAVVLVDASGNRRTLIAESDANEIISVLTGTAPEQAAGTNDASSDRMQRQAA